MVSAPSPGRKLHILPIPYKIERETQKFFVGLSLRDTIASNNNEECLFLSYGAAIMADDIKAFNIRMPKEMWVFLRKISITKEESMNEIILDCIQAYKEKLAKKAKNKRK